MKHTKTTRFAALLLCVLMMLGTLVACDGQEGDADATTATTTTATTTTTIKPTDQPNPPEEPRVFATTLAQMELDGDGGMSYVIQLRDGRFIVVDGGVASTNHRTSLYLYLTERSGGAKPVIACWILTHMDGDHFNNMYAFLSSYRSSVTVECMAYTFPEESDFRILGNESQSVKDYKESAIATLKDKSAKWKTIQSWLPNTEFWDMRLGDKRTFADVNLWVLITANEKVPEVVYSHNQRSAVIKFTFTQNTATSTDDMTFMLFGDSGGDARCQWLLDRYSRHTLQCDVMQVIHHGLSGGYKPLYEAVDPDICLWPTYKARFLGRVDSDGDGDYTDETQWCTDAKFNVYLRDDSIKKRQHYHHSQTTVIRMSDLSVSFWGN